MKIYIDIILFEHQIIVQCWTYPSKEGVNKVATSKDANRVWILACLDI